MDCNVWKKSKEVARIEPRTTSAMTRPKWISACRLIHFIFGFFFHLPGILMKAREGQKSHTTMIFVSRNKLTLLCLVPSYHLPLVNKIWTKLKSNPGPPAQQASLYRLHLHVDVSVYNEARGYYHAAVSLLDVSHQRCQKKLFYRYKQVLTNTGPRSAAWFFKISR